MPDSRTVAASRNEVLKICPRGVRNHLLLQVEFEGETLRLYNGSYHGRTITEAGIREFIEHNRSRARTIICAYAASVSDTPTTAPDAGQLAVPEEERRRRQAERHRVSCSCLGEAEDCPRCFGRGFYFTDGLGNAV